MQMKIRNTVLVITIAAGVVGCRYDEAENRENLVDPFESTVRISSTKIGKIDWNDSNLALIYDEGGDPFSPREILTLRFADRMLQCECFYNDNRYGVPYLYLHHRCTIDEWSYICNILKGCNMERWSTDYEATGMCGGTSWTIELFRSGYTWKRIHGYNAGPDNFEQFLKLKKFAMKHPAAKHVSRR